MHAPGVEVRPLKQISGSRRVLRGLLHQRARPGREPDRRAERRLADRADDARLRARRQHAEPRRPLAAVVRAAAGGRQRAAQRRHPASTTRSSARSSGRSRRDRGAALRLAAHPLGGREGQAAGAGVLDRQAVLLRTGQARPGAHPGDPRPVRAADRRRPGRYLSPDGGEDEDDSWPCALVRLVAETIYAGSSQIQKNIIGERVLGLPKEVRADRLGRDTRALRSS